jgi:hypothetical protein
VAVAPRELRPGLWRWVIRHPEWQPGEAESAYDWPPDVGSVAVLADEELLFIDPLVPADEVEGFWAFADGLAGQAGRVSVLRTIEFHERSCEQVTERYGASRDDAIAAVELIRPPGAGEALVWIPRFGALVPGDSLIGAEGGGLRLCPASWLEFLGTGIGLDGLRRALAQALLGLPVEMVLVSHGDPVLEGGSDALAAALAAR